MSESTTTIEKTTETHAPVESKSEQFMSAIWRPCMGFTYMIICLFDFVLGPMMNTAFAFHASKEMVVWKSLTMSDGGMFHISMGAILGVAAWARGQEKTTTSTK